MAEKKGGAVGKASARARERERRYSVDAGAFTSEYTGAREKKPLSYRVA
jgi:hypothetical protein